MEKHMLTCTCDRCSAARLAAQPIPLDDNPNARFRVGERPVPITLGRAIKAAQWSRKVGEHFRIQRA